MNVGCIISVFSFVAMVSSMPALAAAKRSGFKLKPGAAGALCLKCHRDFEEKVQRKFLHTPVAKRRCTGCHNPHTSDHGKLLADDPARICDGCHGDLLPTDSVSVHAPVVLRACTRCHDVHGSQTAGILLKTEVELCASCHEGIVTAANEAKYKHRPLVEQGCTTCHDPHASKTSAKLLKESTDALCTGCHDVKKKSIRNRHMNYPVTGRSCSGCHDPHGSNRRGMIYDGVHKPVVSRMCDQCHYGPAESQALDTKRDGVELCVGCHSGVVTGMLNHNRVHWPLLDAKGCLNCHSPHASRDAKLLRGSPEKTCGSCHADTILRHNKSPTQHQPIAKGQCTACHDPHGSDNDTLLTKPDTVKLCGSCHDWQSHSTHPIGKEIVDPRNPNLNVDCLSCHRSHGTEFEKLIPNANTTKLCTQCHQRYRR